MLRITVKILSSASLEDIISWLSVLLGSKTKGQLCFLVDPAWAERKQLSVVEPLTALTGAMLQKLC